MPTRVLVDRHHVDLFESLRLLFEERLGWDFYTQIGLEWYTEGYWHVFDHIATAEQYLSLDLDSSGRRQTGHREHAETMAGPSSAGQACLVDEDCYVIHGGTWQPDSRPSKAVTLEQAKAMSFDVIVSSMPIHFELLERFRQQYQPGAKHILQMGNNWQVPPGCMNVLNSTAVPVPPGINHVSYHQEFSLKQFHPGPCAEPQSVANLMHYQPFEAAFFDIAARLPDWRFTSYGAGNRDCGVSGDISEAIRSHGFIWHVKPGGDGYGYNVHCSLACGRPLIVCYDWIKNTTAEQVCIPNETCVVVDPPWNPEVVMVQLQNALPRWDKMSRMAEQRFRDVVDFDAEFMQIKAFIERLQ